MLLHTLKELGHTGEFILRNQRVLESAKKVLPKVQWTYSPQALPKMYHLESLNPNYLDQGFRQLAGAQYSCICVSTLSCADLFYSATIT